MNNTHPTKYRGWTKALTKGNQFLIFIRHPPCYSYKVKSGRSLCLFLYLFLLSLSFLRLSRVTCTNCLCPSPLQFRYSHHWFTVPNEKNEKYYTVATIPKSKVIIIKTFVLLSRLPGICYLVWFGLFCVCPFVLLLANAFKLFGYSIFRLCAYLMNGIPERCHVHLIRHLGF